MNDHDAALQDHELASAYLDGEATAHERAMVEASPELLALVVAMLLWSGTSHRPAGEVGALDDMDLLADADAFDIAQESDLDFIEWAAAQGEQDESGG